MVGSLLCLLPPIGLRLVRHVTFLLYSCPERWTAKTLWPDRDMSNRIFSVLPPRAWEKPGARPSAGDRMMTGDYAIGAPNKLFEDKPQP